jgi:HTH-type transcriptional regulator/antitoxin HigA
MGREKFSPDWAVHPGEVLAEHMQARGLTQARLARQAGLSRKLVCDIVHGRNAITARTALRLERVLDLDAETWLRLQNMWDLHQARRGEAA